MVNITSNNAIHATCARISKENRYQHCLELLSIVSWSWSVCDADAAQVKRAIRKDQKENSSIITKPQEIVKIINSVGKHEGRIIDISKSDHDTKSLTGISKFHNFTFNPGSMNVYASLYSTTNSIDKTWHVTVSTRNNE